MNEVSTGLINTWLIVSLIFFILNIGLFIGLLIFMSNLMKWMKEMKPKIEAIGTRVEAIGKNVEELTEHVKTTAESVGGKAKSVATSVDSIAHLASTTFERFSPYVMGALTAMKLFSGFVQMKRSIAPKSLEVTTNKTKVKRDKASAA
jgi:hypothetical protein